MLLDEALPRWDTREVHRIATDEPAAALLAAVDDLTWAEVPVFKALMKVRGFGRSGLREDSRVRAWFTSAGFVEAGRTGDQILVVTVQPGRFRGPRIYQPDTVEAFRDHAEAGRIKIAFDFRVVDGQLVTETRVVSTDTRSRRIFAAYWLGIRPFSGIIRRVWLRAIRERAARTEGQ